MKIDFLGIPVDSLTLNDTVDVIDEAIRTKRATTHVVINAGKVVAMKRDRLLFQSVVSCDIVSADGQSIVWAARFLGKTLPERVAGIDLMKRLVELAHQRRYRCFFLGAEESIVRNVVDQYALRYGQSIIAGFRNGYFTKGEEPDVARQISDSGAQLLFVAMSSPKKERFLYEQRQILANVPFTMGVGGSFDVIAGATKRAPMWMQNLGMEWFFRFLQEPRRMWKRYLIGNTQFVALVLKEKLKLS